MRRSVTTKQQSAAWLRRRTPYMTVMLVSSHTTPMKIKNPWEEKREKDARAACRGDWRESGTGIRL